MSEVRLEAVAAEQAGTLRQLFQLYAYDFSEHVPLVVGEDGRFAAAVDDAWWSAPDHHPFFIRHDGRLAGFALARRGSRITTARDVMDVAEFFVLRAERRAQVGLRAGRALLDAFPGAWELRVRRSNPAAWAFWRRVAARRGELVSETAFTASDVEWDVLRVGVAGVTQLLE